MPKTKFDDYYHRVQRELMREYRACKQGKSYERQLDDWRETKVPEIAYAIAIQEDEEQFWVLKNIFKRGI